MFLLMRNMEEITDYSLERVKVLETIRLSNETGMNREGSKEGLGLSKRVKIEE